MTFYHYPVCWGCACGWMPDYAGDATLNAQLWHHLQDNGWVAV